MPSQSKMVNYVFSVPIFCLPACAGRALQRAWQECWPEIQSSLLYSSFVVPFALIHRTFYDATINLCLLYFNFLFWLVLIFIILDYKFCPTESFDISDCKLQIQISTFKCTSSFDHAKAFLED